MFKGILAEILDTECVCIDAAANKFSFQDNIDIFDLVQRGKLRLESEPHPAGANVVFTVRETASHCQYEVHGAIDNEHHTITLY